MPSESLQFSGTPLDTLGVGGLPLTSYSGSLNVDYASGAVSGSLEVAPALGIDLTTYNSFTITPNVGGGYTITGTGQTAGLAASTISIQYTGTAPSSVSTQYYAAGVEAAAGTNGPVSSSALVCFAAGTRILTTRGEIEVEALAVGDCVVTTSGEPRPIRWLGHRIVDCRRHPRPHEAMPVRIVAHALGDNRPARDLRVSPGHAICLDLLGEVLVPASALVNGTTIAQENVDTVTYWHVELDSHDILLAENLSCESYMDVGNRSFFAEADVTALNASPDGRPATTADYCRPFHPAESRLVAVVRDQLRRRAETLGWRLEAPAAPDDLWLEVDGVRVVLARSGLVARAILPATAREVHLCSTHAVPAWTTGDPDGRRLGAKLAALTIDDGLACRREIGCGDPRLADGFHADEGTHRWSDGRARLPSELWAAVRADFILRIALADFALPRWVAVDAAQGMAQTRAA